MSLPRSFRIALPFLALAIAWLGAFAHASTIVRFQTSLGNIDVRLYDSVTPISVANFLSYVTTNRYNNTFIHRVPQLPTGGTANFVVQGGGFLLNNSIFNAAGIALDPPIGNEPHFSNIRGTLAFAKNAAGATSQWFFNIGDNSSLDAQDFTVFGRVIGGMSVVDAINNLPVVNASVAENAPGEDFDEIPVLDFDKVIQQQDITSSEAVMINRILIRTAIPAGDYNLTGTVTVADYNVWRSTFGSTTDARADGNGNGIVDAADYIIWRKAMSQGAGSGSFVVPEPSSAALAIAAAFMLASCRRRSFFRRTV